MNTLGRPSDLWSAPKRKAIVKLVAMGVPRTTAAQSLGVARKTFERWWREAGAAELRRDEGLPLSEYDVLLITFRARVETAEGQWLAKQVVGVARSGLVQPMAALELMRRHPVSRPEWNVPEKVDLTLDTADEPPEDPVALEREIARLEKIARERASVKEGAET